MKSNGLMVLWPGGVLNNQQSTINAKQQATNDVKDCAQKTTKTATKHMFSKNQYNTR